MQNPFDRSKSLQELEGEDWGEPAHHSNLVRTLHRLHRKPLKDYSTEDLRICILQNISLPYLMLLAVERLEPNPLAEGDYYPGDLLYACLTIGGSFWSSYPRMLRQFRESLRNAKALLPLQNDAGSEVIEKALAEAQGVFTERTQHLP